jgi:hypothetical protein
MAEGGGGFLGRGSAQIKVYAYTGNGIDYPGSTSDWTLISSKFFNSGPDTIKTELESRFEFNLGSVVPTSTNDYYSFLLVVDNVDNLKIWWKRQLADNPGMGRELKETVEDRTSLLKSPGQYFTVFLVNPMTLGQES